VESAAAEVAGAVSNWPFQLARATAVATVLLILFGGSVTTMGAGMAVDGWWDAEGHFLPFFPLDKWFRDLGTFVEHSHRQVGILVGLLAIATVLATWRLDRRASSNRWALAALVAIVAQGTLGGVRVLENSEDYAFIHGAFAQAVFALLASTARVLSPRWETLRSRTGLPARRLVTGVAIMVYIQVVLGCWYRHGLRPMPIGDLRLRLYVHVGLAVVVLCTLLWLGRRLSGAGLVREGRRLMILVLVQVGLGLGAWGHWEPEAVGLTEGTLTVLHVLGGALLLAEIVGLALRTAPAGESPDADGGAPATETVT
jgi:cytochrome c oxidase assembly protein subunit 15